MNAWSTVIRNDTINQLRIEFETWKNISITDESVRYAEIASSSSTPSFMNRIFEQSESQINHEIEIDNYLNVSITPILPKNTD
ncbi:9263_t:CDS:1, partial [Scutellospora calospora]